MAMLQMLSKVIGAEKLLGLIALSKFVHVIQMLAAGVPIGRQWEFFTAISANIGHARMSWRGVESGLDACKRSARPRMTSQVERVLVSLGLVLIFEAIGTELAGVLLLELVDAAVPVSMGLMKGRWESAGYDLPQVLLAIELLRLLRAAFANVGSHNTADDGILSRLEDAVRGHLPHAVSLRMFVLGKTSLVVRSR
jgi:hypothetical protein